MNQLIEYEDFKLECLGEIEDFVYDIEVEGNHNFFANDILVHNSIYVTLDPFAESMGWVGLERDAEIDAIDQFEKTKLKPLISQWCDEMALTVNAHEQRMFWGREVISLQGGVFQAKKRYTMLVDDSEGVRYNEPKLKVTGLESKKSSTPELCVGWLETCYTYAIKGDEDALHAAIKSYKEIWMAQDPAEIGLASSCSSVNKYMDRGQWLSVKGTPYQASASILHNKLVTDKGISIPLISDGSKIIIVNLKDNNPLGNGYIAFQDYWPDEFEDVKMWINYEGLFEKNFLKPLKLLLDAVNMDVKKRVNLMKFFVKK